MAANQIDLTTVAEVASYLGTTTAGLGAGCVSLMQAMVTGASQTFLSRAGLATLNSVMSFSENYDGNGNAVLGLDNQLILAVSSLYVSGSPIQPSTTANQPGYYIDRQQKFVCIRGGWNSGRSGWVGYGQGNPGQGSYATFGRGGYIFQRGQGNIAISYTAGWAFPVVNEAQTVTAGTITLAQTGGVYSWYSTQGVIYANGTPFVQVASSPAVGQFTVSAAGVYGFNAGDNTQAVLNSYTYQGPPADVYDKVTQLVSVNWKRKSWIDQESQILTGVGESTYRAWIWPPEVEDCLRRYARRARG